MGQSAPGYWCQEFQASIRLPRSLSGQSFKMGVIMKSKWEMAEEVLCQLSVALYLV